MTIKNVSFKSYMVDNSFNLFYSSICSNRFDVIPFD